MKRVSLLLVLSLIFSIVLMPAHADSVSVKTKNVDGITYLPFRELFEQSGFEVSWDDYRFIARASKEGATIELKAGLQYFTYNGVLLNAKTQAKNIDGSLYMPLKAANQVFADIHENKTGLAVSNQLIAIDDGMRTLKTPQEIKAMKTFIQPPLLYKVGGALGDASPMMEGEADVNGLEEATAQSAKSNDFSGTNNQEEGVDEADFVKVDGEFIYTVRDNRLMVITPGKDLSILHNIKLDNIEPTDLFVTENKIVVMGRSVQNPGLIGKLIKGFSYDNTRTAIYIYDKSNLGSNVASSAPQLLKKYFVNGNLLQGRNIDNNVYLVLADYGIDASPFRVYGVDAKSNTVEFSNTPSEVSYLPGYASEDMMYTVGINLNDLSDDGLDVKSYMNNANTVYADKNSLFIAIDYNYMYWDNNQDTTLLKFDFDHGKINYKAKSRIKGYLHNQFSMGSYKGNLRVAVTDYDMASNKTFNHLYILDQDMKVIGSLKGLAPDETIYSVRMMGDKIYMVTFRQVDPFYVIDASMPTNPKVLGYLKIPGYSSYLHPYDEHTVIGIGMNTKVIDGNRVVNDGVKVALYDVTDVTHPIEKDAKIFADGESYTDVGYDHKAFLFNKEKGIMAIPITVYDNDYNAKQNAHVFGFNEDGKLNYKGAISHDDIKTNHQVESWHSAINRIFYIDNGLYTMSYNFIKENDINTLKFIKGLSLNDKPEIINEKPVVNLSGYITEVTPDGRIQLNNSQWVSVDDETVYPDDNKLQLGNFIEGYTESSADVNYVYAKVITTNTAAQNMTEKFKGIVTKIDGDRAIVNMYKDNQKTGSLVYVYYKQFFSGENDLVIGDVVRVYHSGRVMKSNPLQIHEGLVIKLQN